MRQFSLLIQRAELLGGRVADVRVAEGRISTIGSLAPVPGELVLEAHGGRLLPGLHDHHAHIAATAASFASVRCGPPQIADEAALAAALSKPGRGWLRGTGYHESIAGLIDRHWLDAVAPERKVRIQHRSGRLWIFSTLGLETLLECGLATPEGLERDENGWTGRLFEGDAWLRQALGGTPPDFVEVGWVLSRFGITGVTDMTPSNGDAMAAHFARERRSGALKQRVLIAGTPALGKCRLDSALTLGPLKLHLHEKNLPAYDEAVAVIRTAHDGGRAAAVHCVTVVELVYALAVFREAGVESGDRIEHASVATDALLDEISELRLAIVTQPNFIQERGDAYCADIVPHEWADLYRLRSVISAGIDLAGGTDMPFGDPDPWAAMSAAVSRRTASGQVIGQAEALTPEEALALFTADPVQLGRERQVEEGAPADFCLLSEPWGKAREVLSAALVRATVIGGDVIYKVRQE